MPPTLTTTRLILRAPTMADVPAVLDMYSRDEVAQWIGDGRPMADRDEARTLVARRAIERYYDTTTRHFEFNL